MGAGKSTVAAALAKALGVTPLDSDKLLEERFGHPVASEFDRSQTRAFARVPFRPARRGVVPGG